MDSLLANYASSDGEDESPPAAAAAAAAPPPPPKPSPSPISSSLPKPRLFSSLPPPKSHHPAAAADGERIPPRATNHSPSSASSPIFFSLPPPKSSSSSSASSSFFSSLPPPKSTNPAPVDPNPKKVVQFRPPVPPSLLKPRDLDDEDDDDRERKRAKEAPLPVASKTISSFLPAPKNSLCLAPALGSGAASGTARRSVLEEIPAMSAAEAIKTETVTVETVGHENYGNYDGSWAGEAGEGTVDAAGYASYAHASEFYGTADAPEYGGYVGGGEASGWTPSYGGAEAEQVPDVGRILGRRGRNEVPAEIMEVKQDELMKNRPREDQSKMTGIAFGPGYQPVSSAKGGKPSKLHKRKHQIGSLYFDMRQKEMELAERRSRGLLTKAETHAKYGW